MCLAIPGQVIERLAERGGLPFACVRFGEITREVCLAYVPDAEPGDYVIVHAGFAIQVLDEEAARSTLAELGAPSP